MNIIDFESLIAAAREQEQPQRLLFVFLKASLPDDHKDEEKISFHSGQGGELEPVMCVDKTLDELGRFSDLVTESEAMAQDWQIVLVASLAGRAGVVPESKDADQPLNMMVETVKKGGDLSKYMAFGRDGIPVQFG